jgi:SH3-like domain-containing protein
MKKIATILSLFFVSFLLSTSAYAVCVKVKKANLRTGPGTSYEKAWEIYKYMPFLKVGASVSGDWYAVKDVDGDVNWLHKKLITSAFKCAVVKKATVTVRNGPGTNYKKSSISPATQYSSFRVLKKKGNWISVKDEWDHTGWIHKDYLWIQ